jgi:hypothetical protein
VKIQVRYNSVGMMRVLSILAYIDTCHQTLCAIEKAPNDTPQDSIDMEKRLVRFGTMMNAFWDPRKKDMVYRRPKNNATTKRRRAKLAADNGKAQRLRVRPPIALDLPTLFTSCSFGAIVR